MVGFVGFREEQGSVAKKKLKVGLIMGGGVSLGAFNGGAIAEIVKQLRDNLNPEAYEKVLLYLWRWRCFRQRAAA